MIFSYLEKKNLMKFPKRQCELLIDPNITTLNFDLAYNMKQKILTDDFLLEMVTPCNFLSTLNLSNSKSLELTMKIAVDLSLWQELMK